MEETLPFPSATTTNLLPFPLHLRPKFFRFPAELRPNFFHFPAELRPMSTRIFLRGLFLLTEAPYAKKKWWNMLVFTPFFTPFNIVFHHRSPLKSLLCLLGAVQCHKIGTAVPLVLRKVWAQYEGLGHNVKFRVFCLYSWAKRAFWKA